MWDSGGSSSLVPHISNSGLEFVPKFASDRINVRPYSVIEGRFVIQVLDETFVNALEQFGHPAATGTAAFLFFPKTGDRINAKNYRGIGLSSLVAKLINKMIINRLQPKIDKHLRRNQNGFRPGRSTTTHILALRKLIEGVRSHNRKAIILYVDFKKASKVAKCLRS